MIWTLLFAIGIVQGSFLIFVFGVRKHPNRIAAALLQALLVWFVLSNLDDLLLATGWFKQVPWMFGWSFSAMLAYGPLFYLYQQSIILPGQAWSKRNWLHFLPAGAWLLLGLPFLLMPPMRKMMLLEDYLSGTSTIRFFDYLTWTTQGLHLSIYLGFALWAMQKRHKTMALERRRWLIQMNTLFFLVWAGYLLLIIWNMVAGYYSPGATYWFTCVTTGAGYFIAYKLVLEPGALTPAFSKKVLDTGRDETADAAILEQLERSMQEEKHFTDPELKLASLAAKLGVAPHRLSGLINQKHGMSFSEFIARRRVQEFLALLSDERFAHLSLYGLAMEVGFNSKSAFNEAFKRITGKNPSDFKR